MSFLKWIGSMGNGSGKPSNVSSDWLNSGNERFFGLENFGNTCYANSVVQALYFCKPFRECVQEYTYPLSAALLTAASENISLSTPPPMLRAASSTSSLTGYFKSDVHVNGKDVRASAPERETAGKGEKKRKESVAKGFSVGKPMMLGSAPAPAAATAAGNALAVPNLLESIKVSDANQETLLSALQDLFVKITSQKKKTGVVAPQQFVTILKKENELFRSTMHQDAHEMLNYLLNAVAEILVQHHKEIFEKIKTLQAASPSIAVLNPPQTTTTSTTAAPNHGASTTPLTAPPSATAASTESSAPQIPPPGQSLPQQQPDVSAKPPPTNWVHSLFEGILTNETKCLTCETVTNRDEAFLDLSVDVESNASLSSCLRNFSKSETLHQKNKFFCDTCNSLQEAQKRMKVKTSPNVLAVHLKRFKYQENLQRYIKLNYRVPFPFELRLFNTTDDAEWPDRLYHLFAVIVHIGSGPHHGHYVTLVKSGHQWLLFDDDDVTPMDESELQKYYGDTHSVGCGYIFFYMAQDFDAGDLVRSMRPGGASDAQDPAHAGAVGTGSVGSVEEDVGSSAAVGGTGDVGAGVVAAGGGATGTTNAADVKRNGTTGKRRLGGKRPSLTGLGSAVLGGGLVSNGGGPAAAAAAADAAAVVGAGLGVQASVGLNVVGPSLVITTPTPGLETVGGTQFPFPGAEGVAHGVVGGGVGAAASVAPAAGGIPGVGPSVAGSGTTTNQKEGWGWFGIGKKDKDKEKEKEKEKKEEKNKNVGGVLAGVGAAGEKGIR